MSHLEALPSPPPSERDTSADRRVDVVADEHGNIILLFPAGMPRGQVEAVVTAMSTAFTGRYKQTTPETDSRIYDELTVRRNARRITYYFIPDRPDFMTLDSIREALPHIIKQVIRHD